MRPAFGELMAYDNYASSISAMTLKKSDREALYAYEKAVSCHFWLILCNI